jgi:uncharacterized protein HemX
MKPRFTIRDLLWLIVVVALTVGWWLDHQSYQSNFTRELQWKLQVELSQTEASRQKQVIDQLQAKLYGPDRMPVVPSLYDREQ